MPWWARYELARSVIHWAAPHSRWGVDDDGGAVALGIVASGARDRIQAAVAARDDGAVGLLGEIDLSCQVAFERALEQVQPAPDHSSLIFDMSAIRFMDHRALLALDAYAQQSQVPVIVRSPPPIVGRIADLMGLEHFDSAHPAGL